MAQPRPGPARTGTKLLIAGVALSLTGAISLAALVVQLVLYDPPCTPLVSWSIEGACGLFRAIILLTLPVLVVGLGLVVGGVVLHRDASR
jgi:hypothetical protein